MSDIDQPSPSHDDRESNTDMDEEKDTNVQEKRTFPNFRDFIDDEAEVSDDEMELSKKRRKRYGTSGDLDSDDEDDDGIEELDPFIARDSEDEEDGASSQDDGEDAVQTEVTSELLDDDYLLIAENLGLKMKRKKKKAASDTGEENIKKRRLMKKSEAESIHDDSGIDESDEDGFMSDEDLDESSLKQASSQRQQVSTPAELLRIFGDISDFLQQSDSDLLQDHEAGILDKSKRIDPSIEAKMYLTDKDDTIRGMDIPERLQDRVLNRPENLDIDLECKWIMKNAFKDSQYVDDENAHSSLKSVLEFIRTNHYEVSYIITYCKEYYQRYFKDSDIWYIDEWDEKWDHLQTNRMGLLSVISKIATNDEDYLEYINEEIDLDDIRSYLQFLFMQYMKNRATGEFSLNSLPGFHKLPSKKAFMNWERHYELHPLIQKFSMDSKQLGANLKSGLSIHAFATPSESPEELCSSYLSYKYDSVDSIISQCISLSSWRLSIDPFIRQHIREYFIQYAVLSTTITSKGALELSDDDQDHEYYKIKCISEKPLQNFVHYDRMQYILIRRAAVEGFITFNISLPESRIRDFLDKYQSCYSSNSFEYDSLRSKILRKCLEETLSKYCENYAKRCLEDLSSSYVSGLALQTFKDLICTSPLPMSDGEYIMAASAGLGNCPSMFVVLDRFGNLEDYIRLNYLKVKTNTRSSSSKKDLSSYQAKSTDLRSLESFIGKYNPKTLYIDACSMSSKVLKEELDRSLGGVSISLEYVDPQIAKILSNSARINEDSPESVSKQLTYTISLGRSVLYLLEEITNLCTVSSDMLSLYLHPLQKHVDQLKLANILNKALMETISHVGVDINKIIQNRHLSSTLQYVPGMGPRKARDLLQKVNRLGLLSSREQLKDIVGPVVFSNLSGFIKILPSPSSPSLRVPLVDSTRILPRHVYLLDRILLNIKACPPSVTTVTDDNRTQIIKSLRSNPTLLNELDSLDLQKYAQSLEDVQDEKLHHILVMIKRELRSGYRDIMSHKRTRLSAEQLFNLFNGEVVGQSIYQGQNVLVNVNRLNRYGVQCRVQGGSNISGFIPIQEFDHYYGNDEQGLDQLQEFISSKHDILKARITEINYEKNQVRLSCRHVYSDDSRRRNEDEFHDYKRWETLRIDSKPESSSTNQFTNKTVIKPRQIQHPRFKNLNRKDTEELLLSNSTKEKEPILFRPSSSGFDHITLSFKVTEDLCWHYDVRESGKPKSSDSQQLGTALHIGDLEFEDLDDICVTFVRPVLKNIHLMMKHKNFRYGDKEEIQETLRIDREQYPSKTLYCFGFYKKQHSGYMLLVYLPGKSTCYRELIKILPNGFQFKGQTHKSVSHLLTFFKKNFAWIHKEQLRGPSRDQEPYHNQQPSRSSYPSHDQQQSSYDYDGGYRDYYNSRPDPYQDTYRDYNQSYRDYEQPPPTSAYQDYDNPPREYVHPTRDYSHQSREYDNPPREYNHPSREYAYPPRDFDHPPRDYQQRSSSSYRDYNQPPSSTSRDRYGH